MSGDENGTQNRRAFLRSGLGLSGALLAGCGSEAPLLGSEPGAPGRAASSDCGKPRGEYLGDEAFVGEGDAPFGTLLQSGLDGRRYTDLTRLSEQQPLTPNADFYIRTRFPDQLDPSQPWRLSLEGSAQASRVFAIEEVQALTRPMGTHLLECSGNSRGAGFGLLSSATWAGVPLLELLDTAAATNSGSRVLVEGFDGHSRPSANNHSTPGASWIFSWEQLRDTGAFVATAMNDEPLSPDHGHPVRLLVPGWYGCSCIKWVNRIELVQDDVAATSQMLEFASRTHQSGEPRLARDFAPANLQVAAMPIRVERWLIDGELVHRVVGIVWGGSELVNDFEIRVGSANYVPFRLCPARDNTRNWSLWSYTHRATEWGPLPIVLRATDASVPQRRLDTQYYLRVVNFRT